MTKAKPAEHLPAITYARHPASEPIPALGAAYGSGYVGAITPWPDGMNAIVVLAPAADGDFANLKWDPKYRAAPGATSFWDGLANSISIDDDQHPAAQKARAYRGDLLDDWHLLAHSPQTAVLANCCPLWTVLPAFMEGGPAAYKKDAYWSSTQSQFDSDCAWLQYFGRGISGYWGKNYGLRVRPARIVLFRP